MLSDPFHLFGLYAAVNALIALVLGVLVTRARIRTQTPIGFGEGNPAMIGPLRAHANNAEYVPLALVLMIAISSLGGSIWMIHAVGAPLTIGRISHAIGVSNNVMPNPLRLVGMVLTWLAYVIAIGGIAMLAFVPPSVAS